MKQSDEIAAVALRFLDLRRAGDIDAARNLHSSSEHIRMIGSDRHEWYEGPDVFGVWEATLNIPGSLSTVETLRVEAFEDATVGWAAIEQERKHPEAGTYIMRITLVLRLESGTWRVVQAHFSAPMDDEAFFGDSLTRGLSGLLESMDSEQEAATERFPRGTATLMFTDIVESTALSARIGDDAWLPLISRHFELLSSVVERQGGSVVKTLGDGGMFVFNSGADALSAAAAIQRTLESDQPELQIRIGIHTGDVRSDEGDYLGLAVNKAARVAAAAGAGQIFVSASTAAMVDPNEFDFGAPITAKLEGLAGTHVLSPLNWVH